jgi:membrane protein DedA with SNARE-associated domain
VTASVPVRSVESMDTSESLGLFADWAIALMEALGSVGAGVAVAIENLFPPIPSEVILPTAGLAASRGSFTLVEAIVWTTIGSIVGAFLLYGLGRWLGADRLRRVAGRIPLVKVSDIDRTVAWFDKRGWIAVFFGRMIPLFRSFISIPAGVARMPWWQFGLLTAAGSAIWNTIFVLAGFLLGENWEVIETYADVFQYIVIAAVVVLVGWFVISRVREARHRQRHGLPEEP